MGRRCAKEHTVTPAYSHATHPTRSRVVANPKRAECDAKWTCRWCSFLKRSTKECSTRVPIHLTRCGDISHTKELTERQRFRNENKLAGTEASDHASIREDTFAQCRRRIVHQ